MFNFPGIVAGLILAYLCLRERHLVWGASDPLNSMPHNGELYRDLRPSASRGSFELFQPLEDDESRNPLERAEKVRTPREMWSSQIAQQHNPFANNNKSIKGYQSADSITGEFELLRQNSKPDEDII